MARYRSSYRFLAQVRGAQSFPRPVGLSLQSDPTQDLGREAIPTSHGDLRRVVESSARVQPRDRRLERRRVRLTRARPVRFRGG